MMVKIMINQMTFMSNDVMTYMNIFLEEFSKNSLMKVQGENVVFIIKNILTVCRFLADM